MSKKDNDALRRKKNDHFIRAFNYVATARNMNQGELATAIGSKSAYISGYKSGIRPVTDEVIEGLVRESCVEPSQQIYREYLFGNSDIMLLANVTDEELAEVELRRNNPDYDTLQQRLRDSEHVHDNSYPTADSSSIMNAALAAQMQTIESLKSEKATLLEVHARELKAKDDLIQSLRDQLAVKDQLIAEQKTRLIDYRRIIDSRNGLPNYSFPIGAAESSDKPNL